MIHFGSARRGSAQHADGGGTAGGGGGSFTWNPSDKGADVVLSNGNLTASVKGVDSVRGTTSRDAALTSEFTISIGARTDPQSVVVGIGTSNAGLTTFPGGDSFGYGYWRGAAATAQKERAGSTAYGAQFDAGDTIRVVLSAGTLTFYKNGVSQGVAFTGIVGVYFPMVGAASSGSDTALATITDNTNWG